MTTRGAKEDEMNHIGHLVGQTLIHKENFEMLEKIKREIHAIAILHHVFPPNGFPKKFERHSKKCIATNHTKTIMIDTGHRVF